MLGKMGSVPTPKEKDTHKITDDLSDLSISGCGEKKIGQKRQSSVSSNNKFDKMHTDVEEIPIVYKELKAASNWKDKEQILSKLDDVIQRRAEEVINFGRLTSWLDSIITAAADSNTKISVLSTGIFEKNFLRIKHGLTETHMINMTKLLADKLSSTATVEREATEKLWATVTNNYDGILVMKPMIS